MIKSSRAAVETMKKSTMKRARHFADSVGSAAGFIAKKTAKPRAKAMRLTRQHPIPVAIVGVGAAAALMAVRAIRNGRRRSYLYEEAL
jgi:hypothetical protein